MKKFLLFGLIVLSVMALNAQTSFQLFDEEGNEVSNGINLDITVYDIEAYETVSDAYYIKNSTDNDVDVILKQYALEIVDGAKYSFCGLGNCFPYGVNQSGVYTLPAQTPVDEQPEFTGHYHPFSYSGVAKIRYTFMAVDNPADSLSFTATFADLDAIDAPFQLLDHMGNYVENGDNITVEVTDLTAYETTSDEYFIKNSTAGVVEVKCRQEAVSLVDGAQFSFCALGTCYGVGTNETTKSLSVESGVVVDENNFFTGHYHPNSNPGISVIRYTFFNANQLNDSLSFTITFDDLSGLNEVFSKTNLSVYPNPVSDNATFDISNSDIENSYLVIYNAVGKLVARYSVENRKSLSIDLSVLPQGIYLYRLEGDTKQSRTSKLVIQ